MFVNSSCVWYNKNMEKNIFNINNNGLSYGRGYVYSLQYHLVWCTKYRKKVLKDGIDAECKEMLCDLAEEYKFQILAMEVMPDHIHLLVDCRPQFYISDMIKIMKGNIARQMFLAHSELKKELWGGHLWNPSYCAVTVPYACKHPCLYPLFCKNLTFVTSNKISSLFLTNHTLYTTPCKPPHCL